MTMTEEARKRWSNLAEVAILLFFLVAGFAAGQYGVRKDAIAFGVARTENGSFMWNLPRHRTHNFGEPGRVSVDETMLIDMGRRISAIEQSLEALGDAQPLGRK